MNDNNRTRWNLTEMERNAGTLMNYQNQMPLNPILDLSGLIREVERILSTPKSSKDHTAVRTIQFRVCPNSHCTFLQLLQNGEPIGECPFIAAEIDVIQKIHLSPDLGFMDIFVVRLKNSNGTKYIYVPANEWNTKKTLSYFRKDGVNVHICKTETFEAYLLHKLLSTYSQNIASVTLDPRSGFLKDGVYKYLFADSTLLRPDLPFVKAELVNNSSLSYKENIANYLNLLAQGNAFLMLYLLIFFFWGTFFSIVREKTQAPQGHMIFLRCETPAVFSWINAQFSVWLDQANDCITLSSPHKDFSRALDFSKDRCLVIKADTLDISNRRKKNLAILQHYIVDGISPSGHPASSLILLAGRDIPSDIPGDILYVIEIQELMISKGHDVSSQKASYFLYSLISTLNEEPLIWEQLFEDIHVSNTLEIMEKMEYIATEYLYSHLQIALSTNIFIRRLVFLKRLKCLDTYDDASGNLMLLIETIEAKIADGTINLKKNTDMFPEEELDRTLIFDKISLLISEELLTELLPSMFQTPPSGIIFRKMLNAENALEKSCGQNSGLQKRIRLKNGCRPHCTAIMLDAALQYSNGILKEFFIAKEDM